MVRFRLGPLWWLYYNSSFARSLKILNAFVEPFVERALSQQSSNDSGNFTDALAEFTKDRTVLRDQLVNILLAGRDTTAATLSWLFYEFGYHPEVYAKLRKEVLDVLGTDRAPTYQDLKGMKYMQYCLNEVLRLYPIVPLNGRTAFVDTSLPRGGGPLGQDVSCPES
jgi:cytochrome P450